MSEGARAMPAPPRWAGHVAATILVIITGGLPTHPGGEVVWMPGVIALNTVAALALLPLRRHP